MLSRERVIVVAGGTGNIGGLITHALLAAGATVVVPSRSEERIAELRAHLSRRLDDEGLGRLHTIVGNVTRADSKLIDEIVTAAGPPTGVVSSLGRFVSAPSFLNSDPGLLRGVFEDYPIAQFAVARTFLPVLGDGLFVFINGPLAFEPWKSMGTHPVSVATAAQHMLFRALAQELDASPTTIVELVVHSWVRDRETQPGSAVSGEAVGAYVANLFEVAPPTLHGSSIRLDSPAVVDAAGVREAR